MTEGLAGFSFGEGDGVGYGAVDAAGAGIGRAVMKDGEQFTEAAGGRHLAPTLEGYRSSYGC